MSGVTLPKFRAKKYHRRSFWACDECKLRKKKCDGAQPCATCTLHGKDCTYDSKTRPSQPPTHRIRELEDHVRSVRTFLARVRNDLVGDNLAEVDSMLLRLRPAAEDSSQLSSPTATEKSSSEGVQTLLFGRDRVLHEDSRSFFHGSFSGPAITISFLEFFQPSQGTIVIPEILAMFDTENSLLDGLSDAGLTQQANLPDKMQVLELLNIILMRNHPFLQFLNVQYLHDLVESTCDPAVRETRLPDSSSVSLCHILVALGTIMSVTRNRRGSNSWAFSKAKAHFARTCDLIHSSNSNTLTRIQAILCASVFLILLSRISKAYTHLGLAAVAAAKMGLLADRIGALNHSHNHGYLYHETASALITIDLYLSTVLGIPRVVSSNYVEKALEERRHDTQGSSPVSKLHLHLDNTLSAASQSSRLHNGTLQIFSLTASTLRNFRESAACSGDNLAESISIDEGLLRNAGRELSMLSQELGLSQLPSAATGDKLSARSDVAKSELEIAFYWSQLSIHLPFLHYLRPLADGLPIPGAASRPALMCLKVAVNVIVRCDSLHRSLRNSDTYSQFLHPSNWTCIYTLYLSVMALMFLISIHEGTSRPSEAWRKANTGIRILAALRCEDGGAARCLDVIKKIVRKLNYTVDFDFEDIERNTQYICESQTKLPSLSNILDGSSKQAIWMSKSGDAISPGEARINPLVAPMSSADKMLADAQNLLLKSDSVRTRLSDMV